MAAAPCASVRSTRIKALPPPALASHTLADRLCYFLSVDSSLNGANETAR